MVAFDVTAPSEKFPVPDASAAAAAAAAANTARHESLFDLCVGSILSTDVHEGNPHVEEK